MDAANLIQWFLRLNDSDKIAIVIPLVVAVLSGTLALRKREGGSRKNSPNVTQVGKDNKSEIHYD